MVDADLDEDEFVEDQLEAEHFDELPLLDRTIDSHHVSMLVPEGSELSVRVRLTWTSEGREASLHDWFAISVDEDTGSVEIGGRERGLMFISSGYGRDTGKAEAEACLEALDLPALLAGELRAKVIAELAARQAAKLRRAIAGYAKGRDNLDQIDLKLATARSDLEAQVEKVVAAGRKEGVTGEPEEKIQTTIGALRISAARSRGRLLFVTGPNEKAAREKGLSFYSKLERSLVREDGSTAARDKDHLVFRGNLDESQGRAYIAMAIEDYLRKRPTAFDEIVAVEMRMEIAKAVQSRGRILDDYNRAEARMKEDIALHIALDTTAREEVSGYASPDIELPDGHGPERAPSPPRA